MRDIILIGHNDILDTDIYMDDHNRTIYYLKRCRCCRRENVLARTFKSICVECENGIQAMRQAKSRISVQSSDAVLRNQLDRLQTFIDYESIGGEVPRWIHQDYDNISRHLQYQEQVRAMTLHRQPAASAEDLVDTYCAKCGTRILIEESKVHSRTTCQCTECSERYVAYRKLSNRIRSLRRREVEQLHRILDEYAALMRQGFWSPHIAKLRRTLINLYGEREQDE